MARRPSGSPISREQRAGQRRRIVGRHEQAVDAVLDQFRHAADRRSTCRPAPGSAPRPARWAGRRGRHRPRRGRAGRRGRRPDSAASTAVWSCGAAPVDPVGEAARSRLGLQRLAGRGRRRRGPGARRSPPAGAPAPRAACRSPSWRPRGRRLSSRTGSRGIGAVAARTQQRQRPEPVELQAVIDSRTGLPGGLSACSRSRPARVQVTVQRAARELAGEVPVGRGPDVLGVGRAGPGQARQDRAA